MRPELSPTQRDTLEVIKSYIAEHGYAPGLREIAALRGCKLTAARQSVDYLVRKGYVQRTPNIARALVILKTE